MSDKITIGIIGAAGLSAGKLIEILLRHPGVNIVSCASESAAGQPLHKAHAQLRGKTNLKFEALDVNKLGSCDVVFSCRKAGESFAYITQLLEKKARVIDLSGDYRLKTREQFETWYGIAHENAHLLEQAVYGLPEWHREKIRNAKLVANPGCYTTTTILGCAPLVAAGHGHDSPIIVDAISGISGAGRNAKPENQFLSVSENVRAYRVGNHQHTPEIEQELTFAAMSGSANQKGSESVAATAGVKLLFVPHVGPYKVGIMANCYLRASADAATLNDEVLHEILASRYTGEPFVRVYEPGTLPQIENVVGTNYCDIGAKYDKRTQTIVAISVTDNLIKGAAGQAVQNMNIMFDFEETAGLG